MNRSEFIAKLPKAELHLHLEGSLEPELMFALARRNEVEIPFSSVDEVRRAYDFQDLQEFLDIYYQGMNVLKTEQDYYDLTIAYLRRVSEDNVRHVEVFFDPQGHTGRGIGFDVFMPGFVNALSVGREELGITSKLIMCFLRHLSENSALETLDTARHYLGDIHAVGLDSSEVGHPPSKFSKVFAQAKEMGLKCVAHAGEEGPPDYVWEALDTLRVDRLDHGNRSIEDLSLVERLKNDEITLTVCPLSNLRLCVVTDLRKHPIREMLNAGLKATVNSDDPAYFGGYMTDNFVQVADALELSFPEIAELAKNGFTGSFLPEEEIERHVSDIEHMLARA